MVSVWMIKINGHLRIICNITVYSKRNAHLIPKSFVAPLGQGGIKIHMVDYVNGNSTHAQFFMLHNRPCEFLAPLSQGGGPQKNLELNVRFFWNRLYFQGFIARNTGTNIYHILSTFQILGSIKPCH